MNRAVPEEWRATQIQYKSDLTLDQAKEKYPEWYHKRIDNKQKKEAGSVTELYMIGGRKEHVK